MAAAGMEALPPAGVSPEDGAAPRASSESGRTPTICGDPEKVDTDVHDEPTTTVCAVGTEKENLEKERHGKDDVDELEVDAAAKVKDLEGKPEPEAAEPEVPPHLRPDTSTRAWLVLFAAWSAQLWSAAFVASWGVFQRTLIAEGAFDGATNFQLSFIGTVVFSVSVVAALFVGPLADRFPPAALACLGGLLCSGSLLAASFASQLWQMYLASALNGLGGSLLFVPGTVATNQWFSRRRGLAMGIVSSGTGIGTLMVTPISQACINAAGWRFALRILAAIIAGWMCPAALLLRRRVAAVPRKGPLITFVYFRNWTFSLVFSSIAIIMFVFFLVQAYVPLMLYDGGYPNSVGVAVVSAYSAVLAVGRIVGGFLASRAGELNLFCLACFVPCAMSLIWMSSPTNLGVTASVTMVWAFFCGAPLVTMPLICAQEFGLHRLGSVVGVMTLCFWAGETWGNAVLGAIVDAHTYYVDGQRAGADYRPMLAFSAAMWFLGGCVISGLRWRKVGWKLLARI
ncbi:major facilitator superfamily domain-containing protein [Hyaloraphidium curvatum]|nr:major facilitator superfamily domain-containing protein [Hyaloraphidium curvatum]